MPYIDSFNVGNVAYDIRDKYAGLYTANAYSNSAVYAVGDMVTHDGKLYKCNTVISTAEAWTPAHWTEITMAAAFNKFKTDILTETQLAFSIASGYVNTRSIGNDWTQYIQANNNYRYITNGINLATYKKYNARIKIACSEANANSANFGFADSNNKIVWAYDNATAQNSYYYNPDTEKYELILPVLGDVFFYSNRTTIMGALEIYVQLLAEIDDNLIGVESVTRYVSTTGNDANDGKTVATAFKTLNRAIQAGATIIEMIKGTYTASSIDETLTENKSFIIHGNGSTITGGAGNQFKFLNTNVEVHDLIITTTSGSSGSCFYFRNCRGKLVNCVATASQYMGFRLDGCIMTLENCVAHDNSVDGFNAHAYTDANSNVIEAELTLINCKAYDNGDDGASVHENGSLIITGGEYSGMTQAGIAPHQNCYCRISDALIKSNGVGVEARVPNNYTTETNQKCEIFNCLFLSNTLGIDLDYYDGICVNAVFSGNTTKSNVETTATLTEYVAST